jgi:glucose-1-phosphate cytidylyltransferase
MQVVLFCGGLGSRIREYSDIVPKPMIPIGQRPILWHVMNYYSQYGHDEFLLCLGYKADVIKNFFLNKRPHDFADCIVSDGGAKVELIAPVEDDWRVALIDTGIWRSIGERLWAVRKYINDEMFLANYSDGLTDVRLDEMVERFKASGKIACFLAVRPPLMFHLADIDGTGHVRRFQSADAFDIWINGGYFIFRREIFDYMREGEELVLKPFERLIQEDQLMAYKHEGFWRTMDTLKDRQVLEGLVETGRVPWQFGGLHSDRKIAVGAP